jgi:DNA-binding CsgD family transcriptional regulator
VRHAFRGEIQVALAEIERLLARADERGEARAVSVFFLQRCEVELRAGNLMRTSVLIGEWEHWAGVEAESALFRIRLEALEAALRGDAAAALKAAERVVEISRMTESGWDRLEGLRATGIAASLERDAARAVDSLGEVWSHTVREGVADPGAFPVAGDLVEALVEFGDLESARTVLERLTRLATAQRHPWGLATAERARATIGLGVGYDPDAAAALSHAASSYGELGLEFDRGRSLLHLGRVQRRFKQRAAARRSLAEAEAAFDAFGCDGWAEQARAERSRISGRRATDQGQLTPSERRAAELAASGLSNKEIAGKLFISVYTVEAHLSNAYAKLGVRSRAQLAGRLTAAG